MVSGEILKGDPEKQQAEFYTHRDPMGGNGSQANVVGHWLGLLDFITGWAAESIFTFVLCCWQDEDEAPPTCSQRPF